MHRFLCDFPSALSPQIGTSFLVLSLIIGLLLIITVLWEGFETIILPRRVTRRFRLTRVYYRNTWKPWSALASKAGSRARRDSFISFYGPLSLLGLLAMWATALVFGFALIHYGIGSHVKADGETPNFLLDLYVSGTTFFTLGLGDVAPVSWAGRLLTVLV